MKLTYIAHSGFCIQEGDTAIVIDYYKDSAPQNGFIHTELLPNIKKLYVLSTHSHADHFVKEILKWKDLVKDTTYIFSKEIMDAGATDVNFAHYLDKLEEYKDDRIRVKAYGSTDTGGSFLIHFGGKTIFHAGDLNNWHWNEEADEAYSSKAENDYLQELALLHKDVKSINLTMFPIDPRLGKDFMRGAKQFVDTIQNDIFVPMHFDKEYIKVALFANYLKDKNCKYHAWTKTGESIEF